MNNSIVLEKAIKFALRIVKVYRFLTDEKHEYVMSRQLLLSGTFIAKHVKAALHSRRDGGFHLRCISHWRRALETELWLLLLHEGEFLSDTQHVSLHEDCVEMIKLTSSISKTSAIGDER